jgi:hypothetical protein
MEDARMRSLGVVLLAVAVTTCSEPDWVTTVGTLNVNPDRAAAVTMPALVTAGSRFVVTVQTLGSSNCTRVERTDLTLTGNLARVVPYDQVPAGGETSCFRDLMTFPHSQDVQFDAVGPATVRVVGLFGQSAQAVLDSIDVDIQVVR